MSQFIPDDGREDHFIKQRGENVDVPYQDQIVDRAGVGDNQPHRLESQTPEILHITPHVLNVDIGPDMMGLQKVVEFITGLETQQTAQLCLRYAFRPVFINAEGFQNPARQVAPGSEATSDFVGNVHGQIHLPFLF